MKTSQPIADDKAMIDEQLNAQMLAYRKKHFAIEITPAKYPEEEGEISFSTTTNGKQWKTLTFLRSEVAAVIEALKKHA